jgi:TolB-like protein
VKVVYRQDFSEAQPFDREFKGIQKFEPVSRSHEGLIDILQIGRNDAEGYFYYVMELADATELRPAAAGCEAASTPRRAEDSPPYLPRTLRQDLRTRGRLPVDECLQIGLALTHALEHLHNSGLVHRDIKPSNIIFVNGQPKLADIGLVAAIDDAQSMVGTAGYISPEGPGSPQADLYSLGKVLYEAAFGKDRHEFPKLPADLRNQPDHTRLVELNAVILRACESDPKRRYASAGDMAADLARLKRGHSVRTRQGVRKAVWAAKGVLPWAALLAVVGIAIVNLSHKTSRQGTFPVEKASVFVLPFRIEGTNGVADDLYGRITDAFIDSLALIEGVRRSPRKSGWVCQDEDELRRWLGKTNDMRHILTGRLAGDGAVLELGLRLYARGKDRPVWSERFTARTNEVIELERRALTRLAATLALAMTEAEQRRIDHKLTNNLEALFCLRKAWEIYEHQAGTQNGHEQIRALAQRALELDPGYLDADMLDVMIHRDLALLGQSPRDQIPNMRMRLQNILQQDDTHGFALDQMCGYLLSFARDWEALRVNLERELAAIDPRDRDLIAAMWGRSHGWFEEARLRQQLSDQIGATNSVTLFHRAASRRVERRYPEAVQVSRQLRTLYPGNAWGYLALAHSLIANGEFEAGLESIQQGQETLHRTELTALKAYALAKMGQSEQARTVLSELMERARTQQQYLQPYYVARVCAALGEKQQALDWLEKAEADRSEFLMFADVGGLRTDPAWDGLQDNPRFWQLCDRLGLGKRQWPRPKPAPLK